MERERKTEEKLAVGNNGAGNTAVGAEGGKWMKEAG
jgi:hypothetical protein